MITKYYFINKFETKNIDKQDKQTTVIYRNYLSKSTDEELILRIKKYCKKKDIKFYLSNNIKLANKLNLDGAYIPSFNKNTKHLAFSYKKNFDIVGSAHNLKEIKIKEKQKVSKIFFKFTFTKKIIFLLFSNVFRFFSIFLYFFSSNNNISRHSIPNKQNSDKLSIISSSVV